MPANGRHSISPRRFRDFMPVEPDVDSLLIIIDLKCAHRLRRTEDAVRTVDVMPASRLCVGRSVTSRALERLHQIVAMMTEGETGELPANPADHAALSLHLSECVQ
ncbi:hypothetical protein [Burkholderia sp. BCC0405]|uniref:hypothetical protein n=1 Tax=Burkholderia sp. BCC0405 TaxID=2676298 RepID=UPI00158DB34E|nr:hypothetical protein [Burkholderia sp. BCC0405]